MWLPDRTLHHLRDVAGWPEFTSDRYEVRTAIGRGGMGTVYAAYDHALGREVAIKIGNALPSTELQARLTREAKIIASLEHPAIVPVHDFGLLADGRPFYVMKRVNGRTLQACIDAGVPLAELEQALALLGIEGVRLAAERVHRQGIAATRCVVEVPDRSGERRLTEILDVLDRASLPARVAELSARVFQRLAECEARVHGTTPDQVHFHEVGALDAIVDVVGGVWCVDRLGLERLHASRFTLGYGWTETSHGRMPVPPPAVLELVAGWPVLEGAVPAELTTPTGAALVTTLARGRGVPADFVPETTAYGAGTRDHAEQPNVLRLVIGETVKGAEEIVVVECDLDDLSPQLFEPLAEALDAAGASEVHWYPVQMKKRRPGVTVRVLVLASRLDEVGAALFRETTTLGYRWWPVARQTLAREEGEVATSWGRVKVKRVRRRDGTWETRPEYESCRALAQHHGIAVREMMLRLQSELDGSLPLRSLEVRDRHGT
jgi:uncharacterized protein (TIGR00299 family) protein